ncbi:SDR family NAD(P)-dependent oxidoreductase [Sorangium sp. So ce131]|uniref:SDR family NAD(P)-dependent oxidoreductase n=1 Tax=Sorangium sp. So ce131 TaxID=3133282 RepID=UPI003F5EF55A
MPLPKHPRAVVTGASSGLGRALAVELAGRHAKLLLADIDEEGSRETARLVAEAGGEAHTVRCDVSRSEDVEALVGEADRALGGVDLVVNNAGVAVGGEVGEVSLADWAWIMGVNLWGVIHGCHAFAPRFKEQKSGHFLNVASAAGFVAVPGIAPYCVTKAAVIALSETLRLELAPHGAGVTVLCPTFFQTKITESGRGLDQNLRKTAEKLMKRVGLQADFVARRALEAVDAGRLYAVPHRDGRWYWRAKRAFPEMLQDTVLPRLVRTLGKLG